MLPPGQTACGLAGMKEVGRNNKHEADELQAFLLCVAAPRPMRACVRLNRRRPFDSDAKGNQRLPLCRKASFFQGFGLH